MYVVKRWKHIKFCMNSSNTHSYVVKIINITVKIIQSTELATNMNKKGNISKKDKTEVHPYDMTGQEAGLH